MKKFLKLLLGGTFAIGASAAIANCEHGQVPTLTIPQKATVVAINTADRNADGASPSAVQIHYYPGAGNFVAKTLSTTCKGELALEGMGMILIPLLSEDYSSDASGKFGYRMIGDQVFAEYGATRILLVQIKRL